MIETRQYRDMQAHARDPISTNHRYEFLPRDASTLYRMFHRAQGVDVTNWPERNVHDWLDSNVTQL